MFAYCENNAVSKVDYNGCSGSYIAKSISNLYQQYDMTFTLYRFAVKGNINSSLIYNFTSSFGNKIKRSAKYSNFYDSSIRGISIYNIFERIIHEHKTYYYIFKRNRHTGAIEIDRRKNNNLTNINYNSEGLTDLHMAVGGFRGIEILVRPRGPSTLLSNGKRKRNFYVTVRLYDYYDFALLEHSKSDTLLNAAVKLINNQFGYKPQKKGKLKNFWWKVEINYYYNSYICPHYG